MKASLVFLAALACWDNSASAACTSLCGDGFIVGTPDAVVTLGENVLSCAVWESVLLSGQVADNLCDAFSNALFAPCACEAAGPPTDSPTFGPAPDCYTDLDNIRERERKSDGAQVAVLRTYILCPNTVFQMGRQNETVSSLFPPGPMLSTSAARTGHPRTTASSLAATFRLSLSRATGFIPISFSKGLPSKRPSWLVPFSTDRAISLSLTAFSENTKTLEQPSPSTQVALDASLLKKMTTTTKRSWKRRSSYLGRKGSWI